MYHFILYIIIQTQTYELYVIIIKDLNFFINDKMHIFAKLISCDDHQNSNLLQNFIF